MKSSSIDNILDMLNYAEPYDIVQHLENDENKSLSLNIQGFLGSLFNLHGYDFDVFDFLFVH